MIPKDYSDSAFKILHECAVKASKISVHCVVLLWISPFNSLSHRTGYFEDYDDARQYADYLFETCKKANGADVACTVYIDGFIYC